MSDFRTLQSGKCACKDHTTGNGQSEHLWLVPLEHNHASTPSVHLTQTKGRGSNRAPIWGIRRRVQADIEPTDSIMCTLTEHIFSNSWYLILLRRAAGSRHTQRPQASVFMGLCLNSWHSCVRPARTGHNQPEHTQTLKHFAKSPSCSLKGCFWVIST